MTSIPPKINLPDRGQFDGLRTTHEEVQSSASDNEYQHALEVVFDRRNARRRRSSLVPDPTLQQKTTECYVHALLEEQRRQGQSSIGASVGTLDHIAERIGKHRLDGTDMSPNDDSTVDPKADDEGEHTPGQADEQAWRSQIGVKDGPTTANGSHTPGTPHRHEPNGTHSRLLTKKQLSDMAWGVRELSKRLGKLQLKLNVKTVFLLTKAHDEELIGNTREVAKWLLSPDRQVRYTVWAEDTLKDNKRFNAKELLAGLEQEYAEKGESHEHAKPLERRLRYWNNSMCRTRPHTFDFVVTLGGDGTVLYASWLFQRIVPPVLSFALGSLGFLTKFDYDDFQDTLTKAFRDGVTISLRLRFEGTVMRSQKRKRSATGNGEMNDDDEIDRSRDLVEELVGEEKEDERTHRPDGTYEILNDIVVDRGPNPTMSSVEIFGDDEHFTSVQADGVCVATPTGSTAYNLAAGGSLCHPENPVILVTAICAHTLSVRPIILPDTIVLRLGVPYDARTSSWSSFDGRERVELRPGDYVTISASRYPFANVMQQGRRSEDWVNSISGKLGWNTRQRQKSYKEWET